MLNIIQHTLIIFSVSFNVSGLNDFSNLLFHSSILLFCSVSLILLKYSIIDIK